MQLREVVLPETPPVGWVLVRVAACGICGSDLNALTGEATDWRAAGHEVAGAVAAVAAGETRLKVGDAVVLESSSFCGTCELCRNGRTDLCNQAPNFWREPAMGFSDLMLAPACCAVTYAGLTPAVAALTEPAGVAFDLVKVAGVQLGDTVCVIGPGPIALMALALARQSGAARLVCVGRANHRRRLELARELGAEILATDDWSGLAGQFNHVLLTAPPRTIPAALGLLAYEGRLTYIGIGVGDTTISFDANRFHFRKLQLRASFASPAMYYPNVLKLLQAGIIPGEKLISHRFALGEMGAAIELLRTRKDETLKVMVCP
jgi:L-iditol 2-dehydrogenase